MGWLWSSSVPKADAPSSAAAAASTTSPPAPSSTSSTLSSSSPDTYDDPELRKFVDLFQSTAAPAPEPTTTAASAQTTSLSPDSSSTTTTTSTPTPPDFPLRERSLADALLPSTMSCRQAFDLAWACQSPAGQWRAVYRHGSVQPCSQLWDDFWFCMRVRGGSHDPETDSRARAVREHYRAREIEKYYAPGRPSSEDVWRSRTRDEVLPPAAVFQHGFQVAGDARAQHTSTDNTTTDASCKDADEILADMERRRKIRQQIGYNS